MEQGRRLRRDSQSRSGRPRVTVRANYVGLPSMAGRGAEKGGESRLDRAAELFRSGACPIRARKYGPEAKNRRSGAPTGVASTQISLRNLRRLDCAGMPTPERWAGVRARARCVAL